MCFITNEYINDTKKIIVYDVFLVCNKNFSIFYAKIVLNSRFLRDLCSKFQIFFKISQTISFSRFFSA